MLESIKISCPTIYDIATFMAYQLMQTFQQEISEDEIAFLALHVGTEIEGQDILIDSSIGFFMMLCCSSRFFRFFKCSAKGVRKLSDMRFTKKCRSIL